MAKFKKVIKNDWGKFEAVLNEEHNSLYLNTTYPAPNGRNEIGWTIKSGIDDTPLNQSYDGLQIWLGYSDNSAVFAYLEMGGNQLEALRQHLNAWHDRLTEHEELKKLEKKLKRY